MIATPSFLFSPSPALSRNPNARIISGRHIARAKGQQGACSWRHEITLSTDKVSTHRENLLCQKKILRGSGKYPKFSLHIKIGTIITQIAAGSGRSIAYFFMSDDASQNCRRKLESQLVRRWHYNLMLADTGHFSILVSYPNWRYVCMCKRGGGRDVTLRSGFQTKRHRA